MAEPSPFTARLAAATVALDAAIRCAVIVVVGSLIREFWNEPESNTDGLPVRLLIAPLVAYLAWNVVVIGSSIRSWRDGRPTDRFVLAKVAGLSALRLVWLPALANDVWYRHRGTLMVLIVASAACTVLALAGAFLLADGPVLKRYRPGVGPTSG